MIRYIKDENGNPIAYCEYEDLLKSGLSRGYLTKVMTYYRQGKSLSYANILDPSHTGRGSKRLIEIESISNVSVKQRIKALSEQASKAQAEILSISEQIHPNETLGYAAQMVYDTARLSQPYILSRLQQLSASPIEITALQTEHKTDYQTAFRWAMARAVVRWYQVEAKKIPDSHLNYFAEMVAQVANSTPELAEILPSLSVNFLNEDPTMIQPKNINNTNAAKGAYNQDLQDWIRAHYAQGNRPKVSHLYKLYCREREQHGFPECTLQSFYNWARPIQGEADLVRKGLTQFKLQNTITINREYPQKAHAVWSMDGTPWNGWVLKPYIKTSKTGHKSVEYKVSQGMYKCICLDVATGYAEAKAGLTESLALYQDCFKRMVLATGYLPVVVEVDHFSGWKKFKEWLSVFGVQQHTIAKGNARAKLAEGVIGLQSSYIERYNQAFSGMNLPTNDGKLSEEWMKTALENRLTWEDAINEVEEYSPKIWNNRVLAQWGRKPCGKTPQQQLEAFTTATQALDRTARYRIGGELHKVKLTLDGLVITENGIEQIYFPSLAEAELSKWAYFFNTRKGQTFHLYRLGEDAPALICDKDEKLIGWWSLKAKVPYNPVLMSKGDGERLQSFLSLRNEQVSQAKAANEKAQASYPTSANATELMKRMHSKEAQQAQETDYKSEGKLTETDYGMVDTETGELMQEEYHELTHHITGEIIRIKKK